MVPQSKIQRVTRGNTKFGLMRNFVIVIPQSKIQWAIMKKIFLAALTICLNVTANYQVPSKNLLICPNYNHARWHKRSLRGYNLVIIYSNTQTCGWCLYAPYELGGNVAVAIAPYWLGNNRRAKGEFIIPVKAHRAILPPLI